MVVVVEDMLQEDLVQLSGNLEVLVEVLQVKVNQEVIMVLQVLQLKHHNQDLMELYLDMDIMEEVHHFQVQQFIKVLVAGVLEELVIMEQLVLV
jgi:hypothetical protein